MNNASEPRFNEITVAEQKVCGYVAHGFTNKEIATELHISEQTVKNHLLSVYRKLGVRTRAQMAYTLAEGHNVFNVCPTCAGTGMVKQERQAMSELPNLKQVGAHA